jgi:hypothetical protein
MTMTVSTLPTQRGNVLPIETRRPTGKPPWPLTLVAGAEKAGKSYCLAQASASAHIGRTFWVSVGEDDPDEYGAIPGARFEIVRHDGTYRGILTAIDAAASQPSVDGKPNLIGVDSMTRLWDLLCDMAQATANQRAKAKAERFHRPVPLEDVDVSMDLWNQAKDRWQHVMAALRDHQGPVVVTARLEQVAVVEGGKPTTEKTWKVKAEKSLPYDVGAIVELPKRGQAFLTGVRSLRFKPDPANPDRTEYPDFTVEKLWADLGVLDADGTAPRQHSGVVGDRAEQIALIKEIAVLADRAGQPRDQIAADWASAHRGQSLNDAMSIPDLELLRDDLLVRAREQQAENEAVMA